MSRTDQISFFHGTSAHAATKILRSGWRNTYADFRLQDLAKDIWAEVLKHAGSPHYSASLFEKAGCSRSVDASLLIEKAPLGTQKGLMSYGDFYVTMNFRIACNYALFHPTGLELLTMLSDGLRVLRHIGDDLEHKIMVKYPDAARVLNERSYPVVLELNGVEEACIAREDGNLDCWPHIELA
jgi:hypothetical protein